MKKLFTTLVLVGSVVLGANAQRNADLSITESAPTSGSTYDNVNEGEEFTMSAVVTNNGPEDLVAGDTIIMRMNLDLIGNTGVTYTLVYTDGLAAGESVTLGETFVQGELLGTLEDGTEIYCTVPSNTTVEANVMYAYGYNSAGLFNDEGVDNEAGSIIETGNNIITIANVTFEDPSSISVANLTSDIQIYPNPAQNEISFAYNFEKASTATANIMDLSGRIVFTKDFGTQASGNQTFTIPVADLPNGNYTLEFATESSRGVSKFTVTK